MNWVHMKSSNYALESLSICLLSDDATQWIYLFFVNHGVRASFHAPQLNPWDTYHLRPTTDTKYSVHQSKNRGEESPSSVFFVVSARMLGFEPETSNSQPTRPHPWVQQVGILQELKVR